MRLRPYPLATSRLRLFLTLMLTGICALSIQGHAEDIDSEKQYVTALLTAISAGDINHPQMATFANQHLHQATYCLYLTHDNPLTTIAHLTRGVTNSGNLKQLAHFEKIKTTFDVESVRYDHPCFKGSYPEDRV